MPPPYVNTCSNCSHENIVKVIEIISLVPEKFVMEFMPHGDFFNALANDEVSLDECVSCVNLL